MKMTLDEGIHFAEKVVEENQQIIRKDGEKPYLFSWERIKCVDIITKYRQLAEWLKELKQLREQTRWIPVSERLPEENKTVIASTKFGVYPEARYTKEYGWEWAYEAGADYWKELKHVVTAWMPLPKKYEPQESEEEK